MSGKTPYVAAQEGWSAWIERKIADLKMQASIARASEKRNGKGHLRENGQWVTVHEIKQEVKLWEHMLDHCHHAEFCE